MLLPAGRNNSASRRSRCRPDECACPATRDAANMRPKSGPPDGLLRIWISDNCISYRAFKVCLP